MQHIASFVPLFLMIFVITGMFKLAARLMRRVQVSWKHCWMFALMLALVAILRAMAGLALSAVLPPLMAFVFGLAITALLGAWFFRNRASTAAGVLLGWSGALQLTALGMGLLMGLALIGFAAVQILH